MGLAEFQTALARLYTDQSFRVLLRNDERAFAAGARLTPGEVAQLHTVAGEIEEFARSLIAKRLGEVRKRLPLSSGMVPAKDFSSVFQRYAETDSANGCSKTGTDIHREDAIRFVAFVERSGLQWPSAPAWVTDLLRYESAWLQMVDPGRKFLLCRFHFPMKRLTRALAAGNLTPEMAAQPSLGLWWRWRRDGRVRHVCWE